MRFATIILLGSLLSGTVLTASAQEAETPRLSLNQCLAIALAKSPTVKVADMEVQRLDYSKKEVIGQLLPTVDFGANYNRMLAKQVMYMNMDALGSLPGAGGDSDESTSQKSSGKKDGIKMGLDNSYSMGFSATLPLIAPQLWKSIGVSEAQILRSSELAAQSRQQLVNQVKSAYYTLLLAIDSRKTIAESYEMATLTHNIYTGRYEAGAASDYEVLRTSVAMQNIEPELLAADVAIKKARLQLAIVMGIDATFNFDPATSLDSYEAGMLAHTRQLSADYSNNADLRILDLDNDILRRNIKIQKLAFSPTLAFTANYNWTSMSNGSPFKNFNWNPYSQIGLTLSIPILQGGRRVQKIKEAQIQAEQLAEQRINLERSVAMQVSLAIDNININVRQIGSCRRSVEEAERAHNIMVQSFDIGAASYLDLRDSELSLTRARLAYYQAIYNYLIADSELELLQGNAPINEYQAVQY